MNLKVLKATLLVAFIVLTVTLTYLGLNSNKAQINFKEMSEQRSKEMTVQNEADFEKTLKNIGSTSTVVKPDVLQSNDTGRLVMSIQLLDTMQQYLYAAVLSERLAKIQNRSDRYHSAARYYLLASEHDNSKVMLFKKAKTNLNQCLELDSSNLDAKVDLAVSVYNINLYEPPAASNMMAMMQPAKLLLSVVAKDPNHIDGLYYLGKLSIESKQYEKAIERFKKILSLQPENLQMYIEIQNAYRILGNETEVKNWENKAQEVTKK